MAMSTLAKPPEPLNLEDRTHRGENWKRFKRDWSYYEVAAKIHKEEDGKVRVAHLLNVIGKDAQDLYETFTLSNDDKDITKVLAAFEARCVPEINVIYKHYIFNRHVQEPGETIEH